MSDRRNKKHHVTSFLPEDLIREIKDEAIRLDRSFSYMVQLAWQISRKHLALMPSTRETIHE